MKKNKRVLAGIASAVALYPAQIRVHAETDAVETILGMFDKIKEGIQQVLNSAGLLISGLITLIFALILIWQVMVTLKEVNSGKPDVWSDKAALLIGLLALVIISGVISTSFFAGTVLMPSLVSVL